MITLFFLVCWLAISAKMVIYYVAGQNWPRNAMLAHKADNLFPLWSLILFLTILSAKLFPF